MVRPEAIAPWTYAPPVVATALRVGGSERPGAARLDRLTLAAEERGFRLDFAALDLYAAKRSGRNRWVGVEAGEADDPKAALRSFREAPEDAVAQRKILVQAPG